jgi:hypothetical protein
MKTGPVWEAKQKKQCAYTFSCECGRCYHKYNLTQGSLEKSKLAQNTYEENHNMCWKGPKALQIEPSSPHGSGRSHNKSAQLDIVLQS